MLSNYVSEISKSCPIAIINDRIYRMNNRLANRVMYIDIGGVRRGLVEGENIINLENRIMQPLVDGGFEETIMSFDWEKSTIIHESGSDTIQLEINKFERVIKNFVESWHRSDIKAAEKRNKKHHLDADQITFENTYCFHEENSSDPLIHSCITGKGIFVMQGQVYMLNNGMPDNEKTFISDVDKTYILSHESDVGKFCKKYEDCLNSRLKEILDNINQDKDDCIEQIREIISRNIVKDNVLKENLTHDVGAMHDGQNYWVYFNLNLEEGIILNSYVRNTDFRFPSCRLGLKLIESGGKITYDTREKNGRVRILAAKSIKNGKEEGEMKSTKEGDYIHPATPPIDKKGWDQQYGRDYPYLCIGDDYNWVQPDKNNSIEDCLRTVLVEASMSIQFYHDPSHPDSKYRVFRLLQGEADYNNYFRNHEIR